MQSAKPSTIGEILTEAALKARRLAERAAQESCNNQLWAVGIANEAELELADRLVDATAERASAATASTEIRKYNGQERSDGCSCTRVKRYSGSNGVQR